MVLINRFRSQFCFCSVLFFASLLFVACGDDDDVSEEMETPPSAEFDRSEMLKDMTEQLIIPNFEALSASVNDLDVATSSFVQEPSIGHLQQLREAWRLAVEDYVNCSAFGFGPGSLPLGGFPTVLGVFPVDEDQVEQNIQDPNFNLEATFDRDVRGFYAVEYLIYGDGATDDELIDAFDQERRDYLVTIVTELQTTFADIVSAWKTSYLEEFVENDGTSAGSSISLLYNEFVKDYENLKNFKIELPAGLTAGQSESDPTLVEAYYSGHSRELINIHFRASKNIWYGTSSAGTDILGFVEYLNSVNGGAELVTTTDAAIERIDAAIEALPSGRLSDHLNTQEVMTLRDELQANTPNFKSSTSSLLGISITFNSGDGD